MLARRREVPRLNDGGSRAMERRLAVPEVPNRARQSIARSSSVAEKGKS